MKKTLSIILAIIMIVTTIPFAFAAETSEIITPAGKVDSDGVLYEVNITDDVYIIPYGTKIVPSKIKLFIENEEGTIVYPSAIIVPDTVESISALSIWPYTESVHYMGEYDQWYAICPDFNLIENDDVEFHWLIVSETVEATCLNSGISTLYCGLYFKMLAEGVETAKPLGHDIIIDKAVAPDCYNTGLTAGQHCSRCDDETIAQEVIPALNHKDTLVKVDAKAKTCTEIGWDAYEYCTACDYTTYNEIPASHEIVKVDAKAKTCTEFGWDAYEYCTACDYTTYNEIPASHEIVKVDAQAVSCTAIGWETYEYCTACDYTTYVEIPAFGHADADNDGVCDNGGEQLICPDCDRPVHEGEFNQFICLVLHFFKLLYTMITNK